MDTAVNRNFSSRVKHNQGRSENPTETDRLYEDSTVLGEKARSPMRAGTQEPNAVGLQQARWNSFPIDSS